MIKFVAKLTGMERNITGNILKFTGISITQGNMVQEQEMRSLGLPNRNIVFQLQGLHQMLILVVMG